MKRRLTIICVILAILCISINIVAAPPNPPTTLPPPTTAPPLTTPPPYVPKTTAPNDPPIIVLPWTEIRIYYGETVTLDASECYDPDGKIEKIEWKLGKAVLSEEVSFDYKPKLGLHTIKLIVYDNDGAKAEQEIKVYTDSKPKTTTPAPTTIAPTTMPPTPPPTTPPIPQIHISSGDTIIAVLSCPAHLHAYDENGNHIGLNEEGTIDNEIEGGYYSGPGFDPEVIIIKDPQSAIQFKIVAYDGGAATLTITTANAKGTYVQTFGDIPMTSGSVFMTGSNYNEVTVDKEGDDIFEGRIIATPLEKKVDTTCPSYNKYFAICGIGILAMLMAITALLLARKE